MGREGREAWRFLLKVDTTSLQEKTMSRITIAIVLQEGGEEEKAVYFPKEGAFSPLPVAKTRIALGSKTG